MSASSMLLVLWMFADQTCFSIEIPLSKFRDIRNWQNGVPIGPILYHDVVNLVVMLSVWTVLSPSCSLFVGSQGIFRH